MHCIEDIFLSFRIFDQLALALKNQVALEFFNVLKYFLSFKIFEQLALVLKTEFAPKFFKPGGEYFPDMRGFMFIKSNPKILFQNTMQIPKPHRI